MDVDILMIAYNRPSYTRLALARLLDAAPEGARVWVWQNGTHEDTCGVVRSFEGHPRLHRVHWSAENAMLRVPTNWFWKNASAPLLGKVDDDCLVPEGWIESLTRLHESEPTLGVLSCWPFLESDFRPQLAERKIRTLASGARLMVNPWTGGSGYLMKRGCVERIGPIADAESFAGWCIRAALAGFVHGWPLPLLLMDHMEDPRSPHTEMRSEADFRARPTLSSLRFGISSFEEYVRRNEEAAIEVQRSSADPRQFVGWRAKWRRMRARIVRSHRRARLDA